MYDPLNSTAAFGGIDETPPWPTTPHSPNSSIPNLRPASTLNPEETSGPSPGLYGREPQIYGQPDAGLISPQQTVGSNGTSFQRHEPYLRIKISGMDRNRRDILIKFDAQTNLPNFTGTTYRNVSRSYVEFQQFYESLILSNPQTIIPALPLAQTSAPTDEEDDRLVRIMLQRWITRVCEDSILLNDEDLRSFVESDFGYQPTPRPRRKTSSSFGLIRRGVPDEDEELQRARFELTKLEGHFFETAKAVDKLAMARKALAVAHSEMGNKLLNVASTEAHPPLGNALHKLGRTWHSLADLDQAQAISECVILGDSLGYQGMNARSAKETLLMRTGVLEEYQAAVKTTISKRRNIERLKASSNIRPERVDEALEDMEEAHKYEQVLARRAEGISQNLHEALITYNRYANDDITTALIEHTRSSVMYERQLLRELEALRIDVNSAAKKVIPVANGAPRPTVVPPLEDDLPVPLPAPPPPSSAPALNGYHRPTSEVQVARSDYDPLGGGNNAHTRQQSIAGPPTPSKDQTAFQRAAPVSAPPTQHSHTQLPTPTTGNKPGPEPTLPPTNQPVVRPASLVSTPIEAAPARDGPPLGGKLVASTLSRSAQKSPLPELRRDTASPPLGGTLVDGNRSSFPQRSAPQRQKPTINSPIYVGDPLLGGSVIESPTNSSRSTKDLTSPLVNDLDPLGLSRPIQSNTVRATPSRPRLDAREAASKLANMF